MSVYAVVFLAPGKEEGQQEEQTHFWESISLLKVAGKATTYAEECNYELISIRWILKVTRTVE